MPVSTLVLSFTKKKKSQNCKGKRKVIKSSLSFLSTTRIHIYNYNDTYIRKQTMGFSGNTCRAAGNMISFVVFIILYRGDRERIVCLH